MLNTTPTSTPARLTTPAASKLPRALLWVVGLIYILAGLFFRDPWKSDDVIGLAAMLSALQQPSWQAIITPQIGELAYAEGGPLHIWLGALSIYLLSPFFQWFSSELDANILASRLPNLLYFLILITTLWQGVFRLAKQKAAQPLPLPFGGEPSPIDYGRMIADAALLLCVATIGILWRLHETSAVPLSLALYSSALYALSLYSKRPRAATILLTLALAGTLLNQGLGAAFSLAVGIILAFVLCVSLRPYAKQLLWVIFGTALLCSLWILPAQQSNYWWQQWWLWHQAQLHWPDPSSILRSGRDLLWFLWPTWPLALIAVWQWRAWLRFAHIAIPLSLAIGPICYLLFAQQAFEPEYTWLVIPSATLAAFSLPTLRRGAINSFDWFAVMCFSLITATIWLGWIALHTGWPPKIAHSIARQTQGFDTSIAWPALVVAIIGSLAWLMLVLWRLRTHPPALWRGTVLSAGGLITAWLLLVTLWMPALDYARSYRHVSHQLAQQIHALTPNSCVRTVNLGLGQRASFYVFDALNFSFNSKCRYILQQTSPKLSASEQDIFPFPTTEIWRGRRGGDRNEMFRLLDTQAF